MSAPNLLTEPSPSCSPPPRVWAGHFTRPEEMAEAQRDANMEAIHVTRGACYRSHLAFVDLGRFRVHDALDDAHIARGRIEPHACGILFPWGGITPALRVNGIALTEGQGVFVKPGAELHVVMDGPQRWSGIMMHEDALAAFGGEHWLGAGSGFFPVPDLLRRSPGLRGLAAQLGAMAHDDPARIGAGTVPDALVEEVGRIIRETCLPDDAESDGALLLHQRIRVVRMAHEFILSRIGRAVYTHDLAAALGVTERFLTTSFSAVYGMSVHRYLRAQRLNLVRRTLTRSRPETTLVKTVALDLGFWHLGQFTQHYRELFDETPTETLTRSYGGRRDPTTFGKPAKTLSKPRAGTHAQPNTQ